MDIEQSKEYLKKVFQPEFHNYIDNKLAGDFAVVMADSHFRLVGHVMLLTGEAQVSLETIQELEDQLDLNL